MPIVTREVTLHLDPGLTNNASLDLSNLGFLLGTFPSAPGILFYAMQYNLRLFKDHMHPYYDANLLFLQLMHTNAV